jgi:hypothetical protein
MSSISGKKICNGTNIETTSLAIYDRNFIYSFRRFYFAAEKLANLKTTLALHFAHHNFLRVHRTLRVTPTMEAGVTPHIWTWEELLAI